jgi:hypothetical protein
MGHIALELRKSPAGGLLRALDPAGANVAQFLPDFDDLNYPFLRLVDPYGDRYFSSFQMAGLLPELARLREISRDPLLVEVETLAQECRSTPHSFLVFVGD